MYYNLYASINPRSLHFQLMLQLLSPVFFYFIECYFEENQKQGVELIKHRWETCIELKEDYVEN